MYEGHVITRCTSLTTYEQLILSAFDELDATFSKESNHRGGRKTQLRLAADYKLIKASISTTRSNEELSASERVVPPQLTDQRLARFLGEARKCWVLEDFHKVRPEVKRRIAEAMKVFVDCAAEHESVKIIAIGAVGSARDVIAYESNMKNRVAEIEVPLMTIEEVREILSKGEQLLNIVIPNSVKEDIARHSNGLPAVCHQLALNLCNAAELVETVEAVEPEKMTEADFQTAVTYYIEDESDSVKSLFERALRQQRKRKFNNCALILEALAQSEADDGLSKGELVKAIKRKEPAYPQGNVTRYLELLQTEDRGAILRFYATSQRYDFANPFHKVYARMLFSKSKSKSKSKSVPVDINWQWATFSSHIVDVFTASLSKSVDLSDLDKWVTARRVRDEDK